MPQALRIRVLSTYHAIEDGWYLQLPEGWPEHDLGRPVRIAG